jgi:hypothetical protein
MASESGLQHHPSSVKVSLLLLHNMWKIAVHAVAGAQLRSWSRTEDIRVDWGYEVDGGRAASLGRRVSPHVSSTC